MLRARPWSVEEMTLDSDISGSEFSEAQSQVPTKALSAHTFGEKGIQMAKKLGEMVSINVIQKQIKTRANIK